MDGVRLAELIEAQASPHVRALLDEPDTDRVHRPALRWLRLWGPSGLRPKPVECGCARGRCEICN